MSKNAEVARVLYLIADLLEMKDVSFKPRAYRKAGRQVANLDRNVEDLHEGGKLDDIPGVGKSISRKIAEYLETGSLGYLEELRKDGPEEMEKMVEIQGLGPKTIGLIHRELDVNTVEELRRAAEDGRIAGIKGMGEKTEEMILEGLVVRQRTEGRRLLGYMLPLAEEIVEELEGTGTAERLQVAGSLRRMRDTIGDIDIIAVARDGKDLMEAFTTISKVKEVLSEGSTKSSIVIEDDIQVDLRVMKEEEFGSALLYFTGSKDHNIHLRSIAKEDGYKISEYGIFEGEERIGGRTEEEIYEKLDLAYIPPELREDSGEIEAASKDELPELITMDDIRGDLHVHTQRSDGIESLESMLRGAKDRGFEYVAITEHSETLHMAGLSAEELMEWAGEIRETGKEVGIDVLVGSEVEIHKDGGLDYADDGILGDLDIVIGAVHSHFKLDRADMMDRLFKAFDSRHVDILAHPMNRKIGKREAIDVDMDDLLERARKRRVALEIDCFPDRLDLNDRYAKRAKEAGVKVAIDTDAHAVNHYGNMRFGLAQARRGWLERNDVINTLSYKDLKEYLED